MPENTRFLDECKVYMVVAQDANGNDSLRYHCGLKPEVIDRHPYQFMRQTSSDAFYWGKN